MNTDLLRQSFFSLKRDAAAGIDDVTWREYGKDLEAHLPGLSDRVQSEQYQAKPCKRTWIPKANGEQRPIGITSLEDKIVQKAVVTVNRTIGDQAWGMFMRMLRYKKEWRGGLLIEVGLHYISQQCPECNHTENADFVASKNIKLKEQTAPDSLETLERLLALQNQELVRVSL